jgi:hypothetical protein
MVVKNSARASGVGFVGLLQVAFIVLKLCGIIKWSWLWVLSPTWITAAIVVLLLAVAFILVSLAE